MGCGGVDCIYLNYDGVQLRALVNTVIKLRVLWNVGSCLLS